MLLVLIRSASSLQYLNNIEIDVKHQIIAPDSIYDTL